MARKGLTLIEILVGLTILSVIALSFYTAFNAGLESWNKARTKIEIYQNARVALMQMCCELISAVPIEDVRSFKGVSPDTGSDSVSFITLGQDTVYEISYTVNNDVLERTFDEDADYDFDTNDGSYELAYNIEDIELKFWEGGVTTSWADARDNWTDDWSNTGVGRFDLPKAVKIKLTDSEEGREFETVVYLPNSE